MPAETTTNRPTPTTPTTEPGRPPPSPTTEPAPRPAPAPAPGPRKAAPPPPELPRPPSRRPTPARSQTIDVTPPTPEPSGRRDLPADPEERQRARASVAGEAESLIAIVSGLAQSLPPHRPLDAGEQEMIRVPLQETLYRYGTSIDPALSLAIAVGMIAFGRWQEYRIAKEKAANA